MPTYYCDDYEQVTGKPPPVAESAELAAAEAELHKAEAEIASLTGVENKAIGPADTATK